MTFTNIACDISLSRASYARRSRPVTEHFTFQPPSWFWRINAITFLFLPRRRYRFRRTMNEPVQVRFNGTQPKALFPWKGRRWFATIALRQAWIIWEVTPPMVNRSEPIGQEKWGKCSQLLLRGSGFVESENMLRSGIKIKEFVLSRDGTLADIIVIFSFWFVWKL